MRASVACWMVLGLALLSGCGDSESGELAASTAGSSAGAADASAPAGGLQAAQQAMQRQQFAEAIEILSRVVVEQPDSAVAHFKLANCYAVSGKPDEALNHFTRAVELAPGNVDYRGA